MADLERLGQIKCFLFDMDGTINLGNELIPGMEGFFDKLKAAGREYYLLTNNSSRDHQHYVNKMNGLGVPVTRENVLISTDAFTNYVVKNHPQGKFYVLGTPQLEKNIADAGLTMTKTLEEGADFVVVGFDGEDILVAAQTDNAYARPLSTYTYDYARYIKILGIRFDAPEQNQCFDRLMNEESL